MGIFRPGQDMSVIPIGKQRKDPGRIRKPEAERGTARQDQT